MRKNLREVLEKKREFALETGTIPYNTRKWKVSILIETLQTKKCNPSLKQLSPFEVRMDHKVVFNCKELCK